MSDLTKLSDSEVRRRMQAIPAWEVKEGRLVRTFEFADFVAAFAFMAAVALIAERMEHHPNWSNAYNRVEIALNTHDVGGISSNDFELAERIDRVAQASAS